MTDIIPQDVKVDPATGRPFPPWMDTVQTARYLQVVYGIPVEAKTLANQRAADRRPEWRYYGQKPLCSTAEADRYAREDALADESPLTRRARERTERRAARQSETAINA
jgi:hypothetical protein